MVVKSEPPVALKTIMYYLILRHITILVFKKNENKVMEKGKRSKKHEPQGRSSKRVGYRVENMKSRRMIGAARRLIQTEQNSRS